MYAVDAADLFTNIYLLMNKLRSENHSLLNNLNIDGIENTMNLSWFFTLKKCALLHLSYWNHFEHYCFYSVMYKKRVNRMKNGKQIHTSRADISV